MKYILVQLTTTFPDLKVTIEEILQDGNKIILRSEITGTQRKTFMGFPAWLTGLHQLGVFEK